MLTGNQSMKIVVRKRIPPLIAIILLVSADRFTKRLAEIHLYADEIKRSVNLWNIGDTRILNLSYVENRGASFGLFQGQWFFLVLFTGLMLVCLLVFMLSDRVKGKLMLWALTLIVAGGAGNLIDRIFLGYVIDFIDFEVINFPVFNFADICITTGTFMFLFVIIRDEINHAKAKKLAKLNNDNDNTDS
jgi:signal peptidase II